MPQTVLKKAVHRIYLDPKRAPIEPGAHFPCPVDQVEFLTQAGAITDPKTVTAVEATEANPPVPEAKGSDDNIDEDTNVEAPAPEDFEDDAPESTPKSIWDMTEDELIARGKELGLKVSKRMTVETLRQKISDAEDAENDDLM